MSAADSRAEGTDWSHALGTTVILLLVLGPFLLTIASAFGIVSPDSNSLGWPSLRQFVRTSATPGFIGSLSYTVLLGVAGTAAALALGVVLALITTRLRVPLANHPILRWLPVLPLFLPSVLVYFGWQVLYADRVGLINSWLRFAFGLTDGSGPLHVFTIGGHIAAMALFLAPVIYLTVESALRAVPYHFEQAGSVFGAKWGRIVRTITIPMAAPAIIAGALLAVVMALGNFVIPAILRTPSLKTLALVIRDSLSSEPPDFAQGAVASTVLLAICLAALALRSYWAQRAEAFQQQVTSSGDAIGRMDIGHWRWAALALFIVFAAFGAVLPTLAVIWLSLQSFWSSRLNFSTISLDNYIDLADSAPLAVRSLVNSIVTGVATAVISVALGVWIGGLIRRGGRRGRLLEIISFIPTGLPGIVIGASLLLVTIRLAPPFYGTAVPLVISYVILLLPFSVYIMLAGYRRIPQDLEWASLVSGAPRRVYVVRILLPLLSGEMLAVWVISAIIAVREVDAAIMLSTAQYPVSGPQMIALWATGEPAKAAAVGVLMLIATIVTVIVGLGLYLLFRAYLRAYGRISPLHGAGAGYR